MYLGLVIKQHIKKLSVAYFCESPTRHLIPQSPFNPKNTNTKYYFPKNVDVSRYSYCLHDTLPCPFNPFFAHNTQGVSSSFLWDFPPVSNLILIPSIKDAHQTMLCSRVTINLKRCLCLAIRSHVLGEYNSNPKGFCNSMSGTCATISSKMTSFSPHRFSRFFRFLDKQPEKGF